MSLLLSTAWTAALMALGIRVLARWSRFLVGVERVAYGSVLGIVLGSLLVLALAWHRGLSAPLVLSAGAACAVGALAIRANRSRMTGIVSEPAPEAGSSRMAMGVLAGVGVLWVLVWTRAYHI